MSVITRQLEFRTQGNCDFIDLTERIQGALGELPLRSGVVTIFTPSSTSALTTIEFESGALADLERFFEQVAPQFGQEYRHNLRWHDGNGHSHLRATMLGPSLTVPFVEGRLTLGTWQQILFIDFDNRPRLRRVVLQFMGE
ncbi:MAG: YjbQ family protein [Chloroflexi bacterium]|nr:MAG: YjbQ family protein [Chloroflexota bacterium]